MLIIPLAVAALSFNSVLAVFSGPNDPRIERWNRMKIALPDGILPNEPTMDIHAAMRPPINRHQYPKKLGYKQSSLPHKLKRLAPLPVSIEQSAHKMNGAYQKLAFSNSFKDKRVLGLDTKGKMHYVDIPSYSRN